MKKLMDPFGHALYDYYRGQRRSAIVERDDGYVEGDFGMRPYFDGFQDWPRHERRALGLARGRVMDIGCGAGRVALYLQRQGLDVLGIDVSPLALKVARLRGLRHTKLISLTRLTARLGCFDTLLMFGNNFGLFENPTRARWLLRRFHRLTSAGGRIIAETLDPYKTTVSHHRAYQRRNRGRGRMSGQARIRVRYQRYATPYFDYLFVSKTELVALLRGTGWRVRRYFDAPGPNYIAVLEKTP